ncbi:hypothetical protein NE237_000358 [Protea cynaroides]|uniref:Myb-like domain-containing protein n=1 Tax=Protea cynaroides TaxID=273540 RepID=A0A9Q0QXC9_9MAGN|nr:hypothetical protein NE237_000358 [Protea cynaroides]
MHSVMDGQGNSGGVREYRKGNWTVHETIVLIAAKKMDEERRMKRSGEGEGRSRPAELRWKCVEDYCWKHGCLRSQNQCNDKWDNLMRDYKKVREFERRLAERGSDEGSYLKLEKHERKERNLPSNMLPEIYDAVVEVVEKRAVQRVTGESVSNIGLVMEKTTGIVQPSMPSLLQCHSSDPNPPLPLPLPPPSQPLPHSQPLPSLAQILIQVSIQTHQQREGEEEKEPVAQVTLHMKWALLSLRVLLL